MALGIGAGMRVIDLCCGDGLFTLPLARNDKAQGATSRRALRRCFTR